MVHTKMSVGRSYEALCVTVNEISCGFLQVLGYEGMWGTLGVGILGLPLAMYLPGHDVGMFP